MHRAILSLLLFATQAIAEPPKMDQVGDPLPEGATARFGSARLRGNRTIISPDGQKLVREVGSDLQISDLRTGKPIVTCKVSDLPGCSSIVGSTIGFSKDSKLMAAVAWKDKCGLWDMQTGKLIRSFDCSFFSLAKATISPDGNFIALGKVMANKKYDFEVIVYELKTGRKRFELPGKIATFTSDSKTVVTHDPYGFALPVSWSAELPSGEKKTEWSGIRGQRQGSGSPITGIVGDRFFEGTEEFGIAAREITNGKLKFTFNENEVFDESATIIASADHPIVVVGSREKNTIAGYDATTGKQTWSVQMPALSGKVLRTDDGSVIHVIQPDRKWTTYDAKSGRQLKQVRLLHNGQPSPSEITPDGRYGVSQSESFFSSVACVWDLQTGKPLRAVPGHVGSIEGIAVSPDVKTAATVSDDLTIRTWEIVTGKQLTEIDLEKPKFVTFAADGKSLIAANATGTVWTIDHVGGQTIMSAKVFAKSLAGMSLLPDGKTILVAGQDNDSGSALKWLDATSLGESKAVAIEGQSIEKLTTSKDGSRFAVSQRGRTITVGDLKTGQTLRTIAGEGQRVSSWVRPPTNSPYQIGSLVLSPDGQRLAFSDQEKGIALFELGDKPERTYVSTDPFFQSPAARYELSDAVAWSPDGNFVAYSGPERSRTVSVIDVTTKNVVKKLPMVNDQTRSLAWSHDGKILIAGGSDGTAIVWPIR